jgi:hypothetical protein
MDKSPAGTSCLLRVLLGFLPWNKSVLDFWFASGASQRADRFVEGADFSRDFDTGVQMIRLSMPSTHTGAIVAAVVLTGISLGLFPGRAVTQTAPPQQLPGQDCPQTKQDIEHLQEDLAKLSALMQQRQKDLDQTNTDIAKAPADLKLASAPGLNETVRGEMPDRLARLMDSRSSLEKTLEDEANTSQAIKDEIADLLSKLANCGPPTTTEPPKPQPSKENSQVGMGTPPRPSAPKPLFSLGVGGGFGFSNIGGTSRDHAAFLNSFPRGTFSTSANTFFGPGNVGASLGIGPWIFDFNAWRANGNTSIGSGPTPGGGTDTVQITQQFQGISLTGGGKISLGGGVSLILRGGGNFWHSNIDTRETVTGTTRSTGTNNRSVGGIGWTSGAALQVDLSPRWSAVARWDYLSMNNADVIVHLNQGSVGMMFRLFGVPGK